MKFFWQNNYTEKAKILYFLNLIYFLCLVGLWQNHVLYWPLTDFMWRNTTRFGKTVVNKYGSVCYYYRSFFHGTLPRLVIGTSRTVGSAKKFVRITSGFGGGEFTKTLRKVCTCQQLKFSFLLLEYCKIRECYAMANVFTIRNMYSVFLYMKCNSRKINRPTKNMTKIVKLLHL